MYKDPVTDPVKRAMKHKNPQDREWVHVGHSDPYGTASNRVHFWLLHGSPPHGFIIKWDTTGDVVRLDGNGKRMKVFTLWDRLSKS